MKLIFLFGILSSFSFAGPDCIDHLLAGIKSHLSNDVELSAPKIDYREQSGDTVHFIEQLPGEFDLIYRLQRKLNMTWWGPYKSNDPQGDLRYPFINLAHKEYRQFGYQEFGENQILIPSAAELIYRFEKWSQQFPTLEFIRFYQTDGQHIKSRDYLYHFAKNGKIPLDSRGRLYLHDVNHHFLSATFIPSKMTKVLREKISLILGFEEFVRKNYPNRYEKEFFDDVLLTHTKKIDAFYGIPIALFEKLNAIEFNNLFNFIYARNGYGLDHIDMLHNIFSKDDYYFSLVEVYFEHISKDITLSDPWPVTMPHFMFIMRERLRLIFPETFKEKELEKKHLFSGYGTYEVLKEEI